LTALRVSWIDVFTDRPFAGNQLAVVHGADTLTTEQCQALAHEFNYSETTFPSGTVVDGAEYRLRIFTPSEEIPFAGHPTLGTAWVLRERGVLTGEPATQVCGAGRIGVSFDGGEVSLAARPRDLLGPVDATTVAAVLADHGLRADDLAGPVWVAGCGLGFLHVPVTAAALGRARPSVRPLREYAAPLAALGTARDPIEGVNLVAVSGDAPAVDVRARVFVPGLAVAEDAATGSAAAGLGIALVAAGVLPDGGRYTISQGVEMGRPSTLVGRVEADGGAAVRCHVTGRVQPVASGEIEVPAR
jgi:trans-2,3-dihydro-3-hydroxyanthranilate isomerase